MSLKRIAYCSPFVPPEWMIAHGLLPVIYRPAGQETTGPLDNRGGTCAFLRSFINEALQDLTVDALIITTVCDQMRRVPDRLPGEKPLFLLNVPATWQAPSALSYYLSELMRLGRFLEALGGQPPADDHLWNTMRCLEEARVHQFSGTMRPVGNDMVSALNALHASVLAKDPLPCVSAVGTSGGVPIGILGGPLSKQDMALFETLEKLGGRVMLDATQTGLRLLPASYDWQAKTPLMALGKGYFLGIPDVAKRPNDTLMSWLSQQMEAKPIRGLILAHYVFCDCWHAETARIRELLDLPLLTLDFNGQDSKARTLTRLEAFLENLA